MLTFTSHNWVKAIAANLKYKVESVIPLYCWQAPTTASHIETSLIEQQEEEVRPTCVAYANEAFVWEANLQKMKQMYTFIYDVSLNR